MLQLSPQPAAQLIQSRHPCAAPGRLLKAGAQVMGRGGWPQRRAMGHSGTGDEWRRVSAKSEASHGQMFSGDKELESCNPEKFLPDIITKTTPRRRRSTCYNRGGILSSFAFFVFRLHRFR